ncbi:uncharacterized protein JN550_012055 [Neoarthrinium moseri]|uniref:uncharacterized protein n=1 Tax=Neoarthrinium moseri TaxID=1658444 RepID=UPI001FDDE0C6|nr:uncharacterized protein JN550_012055 [Neoarthrinium moseri]KAI1859537.1 hypothetical protein JN550_012055 [Neoarthrinium moseri]
MIGVHQKYTGDQPGLEYKSPTYGAPPAFELAQLKMDPPRTPPVSSRLARGTESRGRATDGAPAMHSSSRCQQFHWIAQGREDGSPIDPTTSSPWVNRAATRIYVFAITIITVSALALMVDVFYKETGVLSVRQKTIGVVLVLFAVYTQTLLRAEHVYHTKMTQSGCKPINTYRNNPLGIPFLLESGKALKANRFLQLRAEQLQIWGRTFQTRLFPETAMTIITDDPDNLKTILSTRFEDWIIPEQRIKGFLPVLGSHSIFTTNGPEWQHSRAMLRPAFVRDQISDLECFDKHIKKLTKRIPRDGTRFDLQAMFAMLTIDSISDFMFGRSTDVLGTAAERDVKFGTWFDASIVKIAWRARLGWVTQVFPDSEFNKYAQFVHRYVDELVEARKGYLSTNPNTSEGRRYVFLDELLRAGEPDEVIRSQLLSIFLAGRDTTTSVLTYMFLKLSQRPEVVGRIRNEIRDLGVVDPTWEQLKNLKYLNWVVKESLRLNPPVPSNAREAIRDTILPRGGGPDGKSPIFIPKGSVCRYGVWTMQRRHDLYGDDAHDFRPERWESLKVGFEYLPFNGGPRICIGQQFALTQMAMVAFRLLQAFKYIERKDERPPVLKVAINSSLLHGCWVSMTPA